MADATWPAAAAILGLPPLEAGVTREPIEPIEQLKR
jgi:hypothetical protein